MPSLGPAEILVILVVALLLFGPDKLPEIGRQVARTVREFRRIQQHLAAELRDAVSELDLNSDAAAGGDPVPVLPPKNEDGSGGDAATATAPRDTTATNGAAPEPRHTEGSLPSQPDTA